LPRPHFVRAVVFDAAEGAAHAEVARQSEGNLFHPHAVGERSQRIDHQLAFAQHLTETGARERAGDVLDAALEAYEDSPDYVKRRDRVSAKEARRLLGTLRT